MSHSDRIYCLKLLYFRFPDVFQRSVSKVFGGVLVVPTLVGAKYDRGKGLFWPE